MKPVDLIDRYQWKKVEAPKTWRPKSVDEELVGFYGGKTSRTGPFGAYPVVIVHVPRQGTMTVTGTQIVQLADSSSIMPGWPVRIIYRGLHKFGDGDQKKTMKKFDMLVAEGDPISPDDMPKLKDEVESNS